MINLDYEGVPDENQKKGFYFRPPSNNSRDYLIEVIIKKQDVNCLVKIYQISTRGDGPIVNGTEICTFETEDFCEIDLLGKYYFPLFTAQMYQWYYDVEEISPYGWQLKENGEENEIMGLAEVMEFAVKLGLKMGNIKLY